MADVPAGLVGAIAAYLDHLRVERGLAAPTLAAYATDLRLFADHRAGASEAGPAAQNPRAPTWRALTRPPRPLRPSSHRRKAAAIRAFYRFCFGEELIDRRRRRPARPAAAGAAPARHARRGRRSRRSSTAPAGTRRAAPRPGPARAALRARACASARRSRSTAQDLSLEGGYVRVIGKGDKERLVPVGDVALEALGRYLADVRPALVRGTDAGLARGGPLFVSTRGRRLGRMAAWRALREAAASAAWRAMSRRTRCAIVSPRTCSRAAPTCASCRNCSDTRASPRPSSTRT